MNGRGPSGAAFPSRVMMTADAVGGIWTYAAELAAALGRSGVTTLLATMGPAPSPAQSRSAARIAGLELVHQPYRLEWMPECEADLPAAGAWLLDLAEQFQPDIVQINGYAAAALPWQRPVVVVCHSCVRSWWRAVHGTEAPLEWHAYGRRVEKGLAAADLVIAPSRAFLATIEALYGPLPIAAVIHNSRSPGIFRPATCKESLILTAGRLWDQAKNVALVEAVAPQLPWPVCAAGPAQVAGADDGGACREGPSAATRVIRSLGVLDETAMAEWLGRTAIFALPARYEPFGLSVLEAAMSRCALVLGDIPPLRELWQDAALFVDPDDTESLHAALQRLIEDEALRGALGAAAVDRARQYSVTDMAQKYCALYVRARGAHGHARHIRLLRDTRADMAMASGRRLAG